MTTTNKDRRVQHLLDNPEQAKALFEACLAAAPTEQLIKAQRLLRTLSKGYELPEEISKTSGICAALIPALYRITVSAEALNKAHQKGKKSPSLMQDLGWLRKFLPILIVALGSINWRKRSTNNGSLLFPCPTTPDKQGSLWNPETRTGRERRELCGHLSERINEYLLRTTL